MRQRVREGHADPLLEPVVRSGVVRIAKRRIEGAVRCAQRHAVAPDGIGVGDQVEHWRGVEQDVGPENRYRQRLAHVMHEGGRVLAEPLLELRDGRAGHRMLPAGSKNGMDISTTIPPPATPPKATSPRSTTTATAPRN